MFSKRIFLIPNLLFILVVVASCGDLTFVPVKTPAEMANFRKQAIKDKLREDFVKADMTYFPIAFGETELIKPASNFKLDSLYDIKYKLELQGKKDSELEEQIKVQQLIVSSDSTKSYYAEYHVFGLENKQDSVKQFNVFYGEIYVDEQDKMEDMTILKSASIQKKHSDLYACYVMNKSFMSPYSFADNAELEFYKLYNSKLDVLNENEQKDFLNFMLSVMHTANRYNSLDKEFLIKDFVRNYVQGSVKNLMNEQFVKMEESFDVNNQLLYYYIDYQYAKKTEGEDLKIMHCDVYLDPYLQLMEIRTK